MVVSGDNLPLNVFCLPQVTSLVRQHPGDYGRKPHAECRESRRNFELRQMQPCGFPDQALPFILNLQEFRQQGQRIFDRSRRPKIARRRQSYPWRRLSQPDKKTSLEANIEWSGAHNMVPLSARYGPFHEGLYYSGGGIEVNETLGD